MAMLNPAAIPETVGYTGPGPLFVRVIPGFNNPLSPFIAPPLPPPPLPPAPYAPPALPYTPSLPSLPLPPAEPMTYQVIPTGGSGSNPPGGFPSDFWGDLAKWGVGAATTWIGNKLNPTQPLVPNVPTSSSCPQGQIGIPPACFDLVPGGATQGAGMFVGYGEAVMGRFGAALQPTTRSMSVSRCPRGAVLGSDGLCYNSRDLRRSDRKWIPGRKPLLTGGDLNAIARASRAANKMKTQQKRLQKLGLLAKPTSSRRGARPRMIGSGAPITVIDT